MRIIKATDAEKAAYAETLIPSPGQPGLPPLYPLYGTVKLAGHVVPVEYLGGEWGKEDPQYEAVAPEGYKFEGAETHTMLAFTLADLKERLAAYPLVRCKGWDCCHYVEGY